MRQRVREARMDLACGRSPRTIAKGKTAFRGRTAGPHPEYSRTRRALQKALASGMDRMRRAPGVRSGLFNPDREAAAACGFEAPELHRRSDDQAEANEPVEDIASRRLGRNAGAATDTQADRRRVA